MVHIAGPPTDFGSEFKLYERVTMFRCMREIQIFVFGFFFSLYNIMFYSSNASFIITPRCDRRRVFDTLGTGNNFLFE